MDTTTTNETTRKAALDGYETRLAMRVGDCLNDARVLTRELVTAVEALAETERKDRAIAVLRRTLPTEPVRNTMAAMVQLVRGLGPNEIDEPSLVGVERWLGDVKVASAEPAPITGDIIVSLTVAAVAAMVKEDPTRAGELASPAFLEEVRERVRLARRPTPPPVPREERHEP